MRKSLTIGLIGLDSSHSVAFTELLNNSTHPFYVPGGQVTVAYKGGSPDMELSSSRIDSYTKQLTDDYNVRIVDDPGTLADHVDAIMITSMDGRIHREQFAAIAASGKPVFINKPFAVNSSDAQAMLELAAQHAVPLMSSSSLRYTEALMAACAMNGHGPIIGADCFGPMHLEPQMPGLFWYGVHLVEMLYAALGTGCIQVSTATNEGFDAVTGVWKDGRIGMLRGNRLGNNQYGCIVHRSEGSRYIDVSHTQKPDYAIMMEQVLDMFHTGIAPIPPDEMVEVVRFMEAANESRNSGLTVKL